MEFWRYLVEWGGTQRAVTMVGHAVLWLMCGAKHPRDLTARGLMSRSRAYQLTQDAREFVLWLQAEKDLTIGSEYAALERLGRLGDEQAALPTHQAELPNV